MEEWARHIWAIECLTHGDQLLTDGMRVSDVRAWVREHSPAGDHRDCEMKTHLDEDTDVIPSPEAIR
jgi:hypothetical protein